jgi:endonuclease III
MPDVKPDIKPIVKTEDNATPARKRQKAKEEVDVKPNIADGYLDTPRRLPIPVTPKIESVPTPKSSVKTTKYKLTPGETPFPDWPSPTPEQCLDVVRRLETWHGKKEAPKVIPEPSLENSGCGQVPSILDALIRTLLSAATNRRNSSAAFRNILEKYGILKEGTGKGSVDWNAVRIGTEVELFEAIKCGGLAKNKSKNIKAILDMVYADNMERAAALEADDVKIPGADTETDEDKKAEILRAKDHILSLDHLHAFSKDEAMSALIAFPGIGIKTASCTLLFCLSRPSFAVDTHVHRLCAWLGWIPGKATRDQAFSHLDTRIPDEHKYELHVLMWQHGVACPSCRLIPVKERREFDGMECPLGDLIRANGGWGKRAGGTPKGKAKVASNKGKGKRARSESEEEASDSESGLSAAGPPEEKPQSKTRRAKGNRARIGYAEDASDSDSELSEID